MGILETLSILASVVQSPSQPTCMYPEQWDDPAAILVDGVPRYPGSYAWKVLSQGQTDWRRVLDCF